MSRLALLLALVTLPALGDPTPQDVQKVMQRDFHGRGQAGMDRVVQDGVQRLCTESHDRPPAELAKALQADQMKTIAYPQGSLLGDWQRGEAIAQSGRGLTWNDKPGDAAGGSCYNCHELSPQELSHGTLGPSLRGFGRTRGASPEVQHYVYGKIYNAKAYNLCSQMPRLGASGTLTPEQIKDLVALLLDPASPVNR
ncbi:MAG: sulfur oxidation c-type cytochrome SoxX [Betaproteobacteria bacterium]|jgi:sulfur-oxidizing protein SoxX|nr:sulfur oxidation c-type cytochrome SoxX [Betaproteobacteria bacterium]